MIRHFKRISINDYTFLLSMTDKEDLRYEIPTHAFVALARRGSFKFLK